jgi:hypothetical protein
MKNAKVIILAGACWILGWAIALQFSWRGFMAASLTWAGMVTLKDLAQIDAMNYSSRLINAAMVGLKRGIHQCSESSSLSPGSQPAPKPSTIMPPPINHG